VREERDVAIEEDVLAVDNRFIAGPYSFFVPVTVVILVLSRPPQGRAAGCGRG
jgi:hypothetical protein